MGLNIAKHACIYFSCQAAHTKKEMIYTYQAENNAENNLSWTITKKSCFGCSSPPTHLHNQTKKSRTQKHPVHYISRRARYPSFYPSHVAFLHSTHHPQLSRTTYSKKCSKPRTVCVTTTTLATTQKVFSVHITLPIGTYLSPPRTFLNHG